MVPGRLQDGAAGKTEAEPWLKVVKPRTRLTRVRGFNHVFSDSSSRRRIQPPRARA